MNNMLKRALEQDMRKKQASGYVARSVAPGVASRLGAQGASQSKVVTPERGANVNMQVPTGQPVVPTSIPNGLAVEESVTVHIDLTGQGNTLTKERIILFDEGNYFSAANGIASKYPAGTVYIGSPSNNRYPSWVGGLCGWTYLFAGIKMDIAATAGAAASAQLQFQEKMNYHVLNTRDQISSELEVSNFNDPGNFDRDVRVIPLTDRKARFDRETALEFYAYHGLHIILTFWMIGRARD
ncbi:hypothetical protein [Phaeodactylibacter xiamenensis]|jgi:hypothetical protein|uniref:hypothetical protein n=1 Tax=Phaeodactylibacter xiamenensis TaxID=1524460 RepID=UPI0024A7EBB0|nr:hypothetical protein [Phaeodactylibacter xiamenensis]